MQRLSPTMIDEVAARAAVPADFTLRRAVLADLPDLLALARACFTYDVPDRQNLRYFLTRAHAAFFILRHGEEAVGYGFAEANRHTGVLYVNTVCTAPAWQGRGLARTVYRALIDLLQTSEYRALTAHVEVDNAPAIGLMQSLGFETIARIENYYYDNGKASLKMRLPSLRA